MGDSFFNELKRRNVLRVLFAYVALGWLVIQIAETVGPALDLPEWTIRFLLVVGALGLPFIIFFSWAFEITPEGIKREDEVNREESITNITAKKLNIVIILILVVTLSHSIYQSNKPQTSEPVPVEVAETQAIVEAIDSTSIAVLPFANMSSDPEQEYFSDGITEELLNLLAKIPNLKVAARTSSFQFKGKHQNIQDIANQLGVATVLEGSIRKSGNKVRITAQLIKADDGFHLWSDTYDEELNDIFAVQDKISAAIVASLKDSLGIELQTTEIAHIVIDPVAHDYYLKGLQGMNISTYESLKMAQDFMQRAVSLAPTFLPARLGLAEAIYMQYDIGNIQGDNQLKMAEDILQSIIKDDPENAEAIYILSMVLRASNGRRSEAREVFERAFVLDPIHPKVLKAYTDFSWGSSSQNIVSKDSLEKAFNSLISRDPLNFNHYYDWGIISKTVFMDYDTAERMYRRAIEIEPANGNPPFFLGQLLAIDKGDIVSAIPFIKMAQENDTSDPDGPIFLSFAYLTLGDIEQAMIWADLAIEIQPKSGQAQFSKVMSLLEQEKLNEGMELIEATLEDEDIFHRRRSRISLVEMGVTYYLLNDEIDNAREFLFKHYPDVEETLDAPAPTERQDIGFPVSLYAAIERAAGNFDNEQKLIARMAMLNEEFLKGSKPRISALDYYILALTKVTSDNPDVALDYLDKTMANKFYYLWQYRLKWLPEFLHLKDNERFKQIIQATEEEMARQRGFL